MPLGSGPVSKTQVGVNRLTLPLPTIGETLSKSLIKSGEFARRREECGQ
jgi:hypothetical protein